MPRMRGWETTTGPVVTRPGMHTLELLVEAGLDDQEIEDLLFAGVVADASDEGNAQGY